VSWIRISTVATPVNPQLLAAHPLRYKIASGQKCLWNSLPEFARLACVREMTARCDAARRRLSECRGNAFLVGKGRRQIVLTADWNNCRGNGTISSRFHIARLRNETKASRLRSYGRSCALPKSCPSGAIISFFLGVAKSKCEQNPMPKPIA
jgi:hypothetical protein